MQEHRTDGRTDGRTWKGGWALLKWVLAQHHSPAQLGKTTGTRNPGASKLPGREIPVQKNYRDEPGISARRPGLALGLRATLGLMLPAAMLHSTELSEHSDTTPQFNFGGLK